MNRKNIHRTNIQRNISRLFLSVALMLAGVLFGQLIHAQPWSLTIITSGNGTVDRDPATGNYADGTVVSLDAISDAGWTFDSWSGSLTGTDSSTSITMDGDKTITATFIQESYSLTLSTFGNGTATQDPAGPTHLSYTDVEIEAFPAIGWSFTGWTVDLVSALNPETVTMDDNKSITANFALNTYPLTVETDGTPDATVSPDVLTMVNHGQPQQIIATAPEGYDFVAWSVTSGTGATIDNNNSATTSITLTNGAVTVEASFVLKQYQLTLTTDGTPDATVSPAIPTMVNHDQSQEIIATAPEGYDFVAWSVTSGTGATIDNSTSATTNITLTNGAVTVEASFLIKQYQLTLQTDGTVGAAVSPVLPTMVNHGQVQPISATIISESYEFNNWTIFSGDAAIGDAAMASTTATLTSGDATLQANFQKVLKIKDVQIPNETMYIGKVVTATISVSDDLGTAYTLISGNIGGYPLTGLTRIDATTYQAIFTINEGGSSYDALDDIPVSNLILTDGIIQNIIYAEPIIQNNDALDAARPVVNTMTVASEVRKVGDIVTLNINADGTNYLAQNLTTINGIAVTAPNVSFVEVGGGNYQILYTVLEGDNDVAAGMLQASVVLEKPSGNLNIIPFTTIAPNTLQIDAHPPLVTRMEVSDDEVGVGQVVQLVITADGVGYTGGTGTVINGIPISSDRVTIVERGGGLYVLNYTVASTDNNVSTGSLNASVIMDDFAGNNSLPYSNIVANSLEIYTTMPEAALAGTPQICVGEVTELTVLFLAGRSPWSFRLNDGTTVTDFKDITESPYKIPVSPVVSTTYRIDSIWDRNGVVNTVSGNVQVTVNQKTDVEIINLKSGYSIEDEPFQLEATPTGGDFTGPGVVPSTGYFYPAVAGTENSPHTIYYNFANQNGCISADSALVFVLSAEGDIFIPQESFCNNEEPFQITASNIAGVTGTFSLTNINQQAASGLVDNGDNTAHVTPEALVPGEYIVIYRYVDAITLYLRDTFTIKSISLPEILNLDDVYCQSDDTVSLEANIESTIFSGLGVSGSIGDGYVFNPNGVTAGIVTILCTYSASNGCFADTTQDVLIKPAPNLSFELSTSCISDDGGLILFENTSTDKLTVESWEWNFGDPGSGDDNKSDLINPEHFYSVPGQRSISLTANTFEGCVVNLVMDTMIGNQPLADLSWMSDCFRGVSGTTFISKSSSGYSPLGSTSWIFKNDEGGTIDMIESEGHLDTVSFDFMEAGDYTVELYVESELGCVDTAIKELNLKPTILVASTGYTEEFNSTNGLWTIHSEDELTSWVWDIPDFDNYVPGSTGKAWFTKLPEVPPSYSEHSWMQSPCFDLSGTKHPLIQLGIMKSFAAGNGAVLQYRDVYEEGWITIGAETPGIDWYNSDDIENQPGGSSAGWSWDYSPDDEWVTAAHDLDDLGGKKNVSFRIAFVTNVAGGEGNQGFAFDNLFIAERTKLAVLEHFTNAADSDSRGADDLVDAFGKDYSSDVVDIQYHMDYPGIDPMNQNNPDPAGIRSFNYGIPVVPYSVMDGGISEEYRYDYSFLESSPNVNNLKQLTLQIPAFEVDLEVNWMETSLEATTKVTCNLDHYAQYIQLYVVVFESSVNAYTGINGDTAFRNVVLDMLPLPNGKLLGDNWTMGSSKTQEDSWDYKDYVEDVEDLAVLSFVQDRATKQILQASVDFMTPQVGIGNEPLQINALNIYPNPARSVVNVNLGKQSEKDGRFEVIDMNGRVVHHEQVPSGYQVYQLDIQSLNRGFYMVMWYESGILKGRNKLIKVD